MESHSSYPAEYIEGLRLYSQGKYWESHEEWEVIWRKAQGTERHFLQALIQLDAALLHTKRSHWKGVRNLLNRALGHLHECPGTVFGMDICSLTRQLQAYLLEIEKLFGDEKSEFNRSVVPRLEVQGLR